MKDQKVCLEDLRGWSVTTNKKTNRKKLAPAVRELAVTKD